MALCRIKGIGPEGCFVRKGRGIGGIFCAGATCFRWADLVNEPGSAGISHSRSATMPPNSRSCSGFNECRQPFQQFMAVRQMPDTWCTPECQKAFLCGCQKRRKIALLNYIRCCSRVSVKNNQIYSYKLRYMNYSGYQRRNVTIDLQHLNVPLN